MEELTSFSLPTSHSAQHQSPLQPQVTFLLGVQRHQLTLGTALPAVTDFCAVVSPLFPWRASQTSSHLGIRGALGAGWEWQREGLKGAELSPFPSLLQPSLVSVEIEKGGNREQHIEDTL